jgi:hypothetical protein
MMNDWNIITQPYTVLWSMAAHIEDMVGTQGKKNKRKSERYVRFTLFLIDLSHILEKRETNSCASAVNHIKRRQTPPHTLDGIFSLPLLIAEVLASKLLYETRQPIAGARIGHDSFLRVIT